MAKLLSIVVMAVMFALCANAIPSDYESAKSDHKEAEVISYDHHHEKSGHFHGKYDDKESLGRESAVVSGDYTATSGSSSSTKDSSSKDSAFDTLVAVAAAVKENKADTDKESLGRESAVVGSDYGSSSSKDSAFDTLVAVAGAAKEHKADTDKESLGRESAVVGSDYSGSSSSKDSSKDSSHDSVDVAAEEHKVDSASISSTDKRYRRSVDEHHLHHHGLESALDHSHHRKGRDTSAKETSHETHTKEGKEHKIETVKSNGHVIQEVWS